MNLVYLECDFEIYRPVNFRRTFILTRYHNIEIVYEDNHLLVVNKPAGMLSQGDQSGHVDLQSILKTYLQEKYQKPGNVFLALVHRLDRPVGGLMVLARTSKAASRLSEQIRGRHIQKKYMAVVESPTVTTGELIHYLRKDEKRKVALVTDQEQPDSRKAVLETAHLQSRNNLSLVAITLLTGRFHQIRAQLAASGTPIAGDRKYGARTEADDGIALICQELGFQHPTRKEPMHFTLDLPEKKPWRLFSRD